MAAKKIDVTTDAGADALEQIKANTERIGTLVSEGKDDAAAELEQETEAIISALAGKGSIKAKTESRDGIRAVKEAAAAPKAEVKKVTTGKTAAKTWDQYEGTVELMTMAAEKLAEGVRLNLQSGVVAKEVAAISFDMWTRILTKEDVADLLGRTDASKKASGALLAEAGKGFENTLDNRTALKSLMKSASDYRSDVRAEWLRSLDEDTEEAAERRARVSKVLEGKPEDEKASEWVAKAYNTSTVGQGEKKRLAYHEKIKALEAAGKSTELATAEVEEDEEEVTPDEYLTKSVDRLYRAVGANPETFEKASEEVKTKERTRLEAIKKAVNEMIVTLI